MSTSDLASDGASVAASSVALGDFSSGAFPIVGGCADPSLSVKPINGSSAAVDPAIEVAALFVAVTGPKVSEVEPGAVSTVAAESTVAVASVAFAFAASSAFSGVILTKIC